MEPHPTSPKLLPSAGRNQLAQEDWLVCLLVPSKGRYGGRSGRRVGVSITKYHMLWNEVAYN